MDPQVVAEVSMSQKDSVDASAVINNARNTTTDCSERIIVQTNTLVDDLNYYMSHPKRGHAYIFNHVKFMPNLLVNERKDSNEDLEGMTRVLESLNFDVKSFVDLSRKKLFKRINELSTKDHSDCDCVLVAVFTHGTQGLLCASDCQYAPRDLWEPFLPDRCPTLAGKPKVFIIQACRGRRVDSGTTLRSIADVPNKHSGVRTEIDTVTFSPGVATFAYTVPFYADILIAFSTLPGFLSYRNERDSDDFWSFKFLGMIIFVPRGPFRLLGRRQVRRNAGNPSVESLSSDPITNPRCGSWFIQTLIEVLEKYSEKEDFLSMLTITSCQVATQLEASSPDDYLNGNKQIPCFNSTLTRKLYLTPKHNIRETETKLSFVKDFWIRSIQLFMSPTVRNTTLTTLNFVAPSFFCFIMYNLFIGPS